MAATPPALHVKECNSVQEGVADEAIIGDCSSGRRTIVAAMFSPDSAARKGDKVGTLRVRVVYVANLK